MSPCPAAPPLASCRGTSHAQQSACCQACEGWPQKLASVSLRPAPNTEESAGLFCTSHLYLKAARIVGDGPEKIKLPRERWACLIPGRIPIPLLSVPLGSWGSGRSGPGKPADWNAYYGKETVQTLWEADRAASLPQLASLILSRPQRESAVRGPCWQLYQPNASDYDS